MPSRRRFLAVSAATIAAAALPERFVGQKLGAGVFTNASLGAYSQGLLTEANFTNQVGSVFTALQPDGSYAYLTLRSVQTVTLGSAAKTTAAPRVLSGTQPGSASLQVFSFELVFDVQGSALAQGSYLLDQGTLGSFAAFLVPGATTTGSPTCMATFSSLTAAATSGLPMPPSYTAPAPSQARPSFLVR
jgi:hypothetical protein